MAAGTPRSHRMLHRRCGTGRHGRHSIHRRAVCRLTLGQPILSACDANLSSMTGGGKLGVCCMFRVRICLDSFKTLSQVVVIRL